MSKEELNMELKIAELKIQNQSYQEYIKFLEDRADYYEDKALELKYKIDKAIEYIEENCYDEERKMVINELYNEIPELLNILKEK